MTLDIELEAYVVLNREIWNEYLPDFLTRISQLNITLGPDSHGRSPAHYAAKNGQTTLLRHLLHLNVTINTVDNDGLSELWYAVSSNNVECVQVRYNGPVAWNHILIAAV